MKNSTNEELKLDTVITFGKFKGSTVRSVIYLKHSYIEWLRDELKYILSIPVKDAIYEIEQNSMRVRIKQSNSKERQHSHDAAYGQAFDNSIGHY